MFEQQRIELQRAQDNYLMSLRSIDGAVKTALRTSDDDEDVAAEASALRRDYAVGPTDGVVVDDVGDGTPMVSLTEAEHEALLAELKALQEKNHSLANDVMTLQAQHDAQAEDAARLRAQIEAATSSPVVDETARTAGDGGESQG